MLAKLELAFAASTLPNSGLLEQLYLRERFDGMKTFAACTSSERFVLATSLELDSPGEIISVEESQERIACRLVEAVE